jgi:hypothetical protein
VKLVVYNRVRKHRGEPAAYEAEASQNMIVRITLDDGSVFDIEDGGDLVVREIEGRELHVIPVGANMIRVRSENHQ